jgi:hypothetical protein
LARGIIEIENVQVFGSKGDYHRRAALYLSLGIHKGLPSAGRGQRDGIGASTGNDTLYGGAVLIENVFGWGGLGQYAVQALSAFDYAAIQGFVLVAATFTLFLYLAGDLIYFAIDPRISY